MDLQLKGKTAVVTGASRGIGRSIAETFADEGANVAICARNAEQVAEAVEALEARGVRAWGQAVDIADGPALQAFVRQAAETLGGVDVLVSNASALVQGAQDADWQARSAASRRRSPSLRRPPRSTATRPSSSPRRSLLRRRRVRRPMGR